MVFWGPGAWSEFWRPPFLRGRVPLANGAVGELGGGLTAMGCRVPPEGIQASCSSTGAGLVRCDGLVRCFLPRITGISLPAGRELGTMVKDESGTKLIV